MTGRTIKCPICNYSSFKNGLQKHVIQKARAELWQKAIGGNKKTPHFDYYYKNTKPLISLTKRTWK